jgi:3-methyl-2-oxobutanoate hydroxymethyltransferase
MVSHSAAVVRAKPRALVIADMPYLTFHVSPEDTLRNAARLIQEAGVDGVKLEGGEERVPHIRKLIEAEIPVMGHIGLTPQSVLEFGGYRIQGRSTEAADKVVDDAKKLEEAGCFSVVLEGVPARVAKRATESVSIPTIGIGAGSYCDGQILVITDLLGLAAEVPRFVRKYADLRATILEAVGKFSDDVNEGRFPSTEETYEE